MSLTIVTQDIHALRHDMGVVIAGVGALSDTIAAHGALINALLEAITADEPSDSTLVDSLIRIADALETQSATLETVRQDIARLPIAVKTAAGA